VNVGRKEMVLLTSKGSSGGTCLYPRRGRKDLKKYRGHTSGVPGNFEGVRKKPARKETQGYGKKTSY